jgi:hypothetical protein
VGLTIVEVVDEYRTGRTVVLLEHNKADEWGGYVVKTKVRYKTEDEARRAFLKALPPAAKKKTKSAKEKT